MSDIPVDPDIKRRRCFWRRLGQKLDSLVAYPVKHALSEDQLRQIGDDIKRCQQLIPTKATRRVNTRLGREALQLAVRKIKVRP
jgi:hypothetical protein